MKSMKKKMLVFGFLLLNVVCAQAMHVPMCDVERMDVKPKCKASLLQALENYVAVDNDIWLGWDGERNTAQEVVDILAAHNVFEDEPVLKKWLQKAFDKKAQHAIIALQEAGVEVN